MKLATVRFDGSIEPRDAEPTNIKGKLYIAKAGNVVYSKIDVRNGAIGIVPDVIPLVAVTSEFPIYRIRDDAALSEYITLLFRTAFFRRTINGMISGASGRKRVQPSELEAVNIPLPALDTQRAIVKKWHDAQATITAAEAEAKRIERQAAVDFLDALGLSVYEEAKPHKAFAANWADFERWGVSMCWKARNHPPPPRYPTAAIKDLCTIGSGGTPSRKVAAYYSGGDMPWVKTTEVRNNVILDTEEKITRAGLNNSAAKMYPAGSLIVAMYGQGATRGRTAKLGIKAATNQACCVLTGFDSRIDPDFLWFYLMGEYDRLRELASGNNQPNLNAEMISNYRAPLPPLDVQRSLIKAVTNARKAAADARENAEKVKVMAIADVEAAILGSGNRLGH